MDQRFYILLFIIFLRYALIAGLAFFIFYRILKSKWAKRKIQQVFPKKNDYLREIGYSLLTVFIFWIVALSTFTPFIKPYTKQYTEIADYGWGYFAFSIVLMLLIHDAYFYLIHRVMHHPKLFNALHKVHHLSTNPSPWAALAFQPAEAVIEACVIYVIVFSIPTQRSAVLIWLALMMLYNVYGHLGYELYPKNFQRTWLGKWFNTSVNHNQHHKYFKGNYGLYFLWWDKLFGTLRKDYDEEFDRVKSLAK
ncbi:sterol desaturase family protein [uncultured Imperialibacter sp.]|uniref:sterol desaturase family protein n=1 Tax=uncultured Imperialibacter sp. TaxID=1672639 RepID=UPI0030DBF977|tara:strand:- start:121155 stop:121907 length:753 start_codon:yes stop_codon:yes gene_type:complete